MLVNAAVGGWPAPSFVVDIGFARFYSSHGASQPLLVVLQGAGQAPWQSRRHLRMTVPALSQLWRSSRHSCTPVWSLSNLLQTHTARVTALHNARLLEPEKQPGKTELVGDRRLQVCLRARPDSPSLKSSKKKEQSSSLSGDLHNVKGAGGSISLSDTGRAQQQSRLPA